MAYLDPVTNFAVVVVSGFYDASATAITLATGEGAKLPASGSFNLVWWNSLDYQEPSSDANKEIVRVTNRTGDVLTVIRAQEGTSATVKNLSGKTYRMVLSITKKMVDDIEAHAVNVSNPHTVTKAQVGLTNVDDVQQMPLTYLDIDTTLVADSNVKVPSQRAVKSYVDVGLSGKETALTFVSPVTRTVNAISLKGLTGFGTAGQVIKTNAGGDGLEWGTLVTYGDVTGPAGATSGHVVMFDGGTGKLIKDSGLDLSGSNTGDETESTIKTKLGIVTLSGVNTGDETEVSIKTKLGISVLTGDNTGDQNLAPYALKANVLELDNVSIFVPNADYEPSTKKYVDDSVSDKITLGSLSAVYPIGYAIATGVISIAQANAGADGYLTQVDWNTFNNKQNALTFGILNGNTVIIDSSSITSGEYAKFTVNGLESRSTAEVLSDIGAMPLGTIPTMITVENEDTDGTCFPLFVVSATGNLSPKTNNGLTYNSHDKTLTAVGFIGPLTGDVNGVTITELATGFTIAGGTIEKTLTVPLDASVSGTNTGDQSLESLATPGTPGSIIVSNGTNWVVAVLVQNEIPTGVVDGNNSTFTLDYDPLPGTLFILNYGTGTVFETEDFARLNKIITTNVPPDKGTQIKATYYRLFI